MRSYFVPLADNHIVMAVKQMECRYDCIQFLDGVHCPVGKIDDLADLLGLKVGSGFRLTRSPWSRIKAIKLQESEDGEVEWGFRPRDGGALQECVSDFSDLLQQKVFVHGSREPSCIAPKEDDGFHVYFGASPVPGASTHVRSACCGAADVFDFTGRGIEFRKFDFCRAELIDARHLYILTDYFSIGCSNGQDKFLSFLREKCFDLSFVVSEAQWSRTVQRYKVKQENTAMGVFLSAFSLDEFRETIHRVNIKRDDIFNLDIPSSISDILDSGLDTMAEDVTVELHEKEAQKLAKTEIVYCHWVGDRDIEFLTRDLESTAGPIGAFTINISLNGNVQVRGLEWVYDEAYGPNLLGDGRLFPSELNILIPQLIAEKRFVTLASHIIHFLKDVDEFPGQRALVEKFNQKRSAS